jgi:hypothetical protein
MDTNDKIRMGEDIAFTYPCLMECQSLAFVDKPLYHYRSNPDSMTNAYDSVLQDIIYLPYQALVKKSNDLGVDLSQQLPYYLLYLVNFVIRNEANVNNPKSKSEKSVVLDGIINNQDVAYAMKKINPKFLPSHTKLLKLCIATKNKFMLKLYIKMLRRTLL